MLDSVTHGLLLPVIFRDEIDMEVMQYSGSIQRASGLTLIELIISLAIAASLLLLSTPIAKFVRSNQNSAYMFEFITTLNLARTEAIKFGTPVTVCRTINGQKCEGLRNSGKGKIWETGWMVFFDYNSNGQFNKSEDKLIRHHEALSSGYSLRSGAKVRITYKSTGIAPGFMDTWTFCDPANDVTVARGVVLAYSGRARLAKDTDKNGIRDNGRKNSRAKPRDLSCD